MSILANPGLNPESDATHEVLTVPRLEPVIRSVADADESPTSAKLKVRALEEFCQLITTMKPQCQYSPAFWIIVGSALRKTYELPLIRQPGVQTKRHGRLCNDV